MPERRYHPGVRRAERRREMTPEQVLSHPPRVLTRAQREFYFSEGYLLLPEALPAEWIDRLRAATDELIERSRGVTRSDQVWDLEPGHSAQTPRLRRVSAPVDQHPAYWDYIAHSLVGGIVADLVGPDVKFHHSKLNFKWARGGEEASGTTTSRSAAYHYSPLTVGTSSTIAAWTQARCRCCRRAT
jgi:hypothetical protein